MIRKAHSAPTLKDFTESIFKFESHPVRVVMRNGEPWFVAADVCAALKLTNPTMALKALDDDEKNYINLAEGIHGGGKRGNPNVSIISESGLYTLILRCRDAVRSGTLPYRFRKWVTVEVLPQVRQAKRCASAHEHEITEPTAALERALRSGRWFMYAQDGRLTLNPVRSDAYVITEDQFASVIREPGSISLHHLPEIIAAATEKLCRTVGAVERSGREPSAKHSSRGVA